MPRKRKSAALTARAKPKLQGTDEKNCLSEEERRNKLQIFLKEFDKKVELEERRMRDNLKSLQDFASRQFLLEINKMPLDVRKMTFEDYIACGGSLEAVTANNVKHERKLNTSSKVAETLSHLRNASRLGTSNFETIQEEPNNSSTVKRKVPVTRTRKGVRKNIKEMQLMPPPSVHRSVLKTPAMQGSGVNGWSTPLVTPKFDPRLPVTPGQCRDVHPGEMLMSLAGSPLNNPENNKDKKVNVKGRTLTLNLDLNEIGNLDTRALEGMSPESQIANVLSALKRIYPKK